MVGIRPYNYFVDNFVVFIAMFLEPFLLLNGKKDYFSFVLTAAPRTQGCSRSTWDGRDTAKLSFNFCL